MPRSQCEPHTTHDHDSIISGVRGPGRDDVTEFSDCADEVLPGTTCAALCRNQTGGGEDVYCKITVNGGKNSVRGVLSIEGTCNATCETSVAVEAR